MDVKREKGKVGASTDWETGPSQAGRRDEWESMYNQRRTCGQTTSVGEPKKESFAS